MKASECKCVMCGKPAVAFWPIIDPDIPAEPYCRKCLDKIKADTIRTLFGDVFDKHNYSESKTCRTCKHRERLVEQGSPMLQPATEQTEQ